MNAERELLRQMLELYSPTGEEDAVARLLVDTFHEAGLPASCDGAGNFVGTVGDGPVEVALLGHIDTVPAEIPIQERDGQLYGRGAVDAKGPMATFVSAALRLADRGLSRLKLTVIGAVGEEGESTGARYIAGRYCPSYLVIGEPSGWDSLVLGYKGSLRAQYVLTRRTSHSAGSEKSAPEVALDYWQQVKDACARYSGGLRVFDQVSPSLRAINTTSDGFADRVEMDISVRLPLEHPPEEVGNWLRQIAELLSHRSGAVAKVEVVYGDRAVKAEKNTPLVRAFMAAIREQAAQPRFKVKTGTSDMNVVGPAWRCPMLAYGPGDSSLDHTPEEHVELEEYDRAIDVLVSALKYLDEAG